MPWKWRSRQKSNHPLVTVDTRPSLFDPKQPVILEATVSMSGISNQAENARFSSLYIVRN